MRILIELPTWLGDTVMTTPAIDNLVNYYNGPEITLIGSFVSVETLGNHPQVSKTHVLNKNYLSLYNKVKDLGEFDVFFSFRSAYRSKFLKLLVSAKNKYQFNKDQYKNCHQVEKYNNFVNDCLGINLPAGKLIVHPNLRLINNNSIPIVGINPGASYGSAKRWYPKEFAEVAAELSTHYEIIIIGGPDERDIAADIEKSLVDKGVTNYKNLVGITTIQELISRVSTLDLLITGDSGSMHIAASFQVPTVAIFGPTRDDETSQWKNDKSIIVKKDLDCQPCMKRNCPLKHHNCMNLIKAVDVLKAVRSLG